MSIFISRCDPGVSLFNNIDCNMDYNIYWCHWLDTLFHGDIIFLKDWYLYVLTCHETGHLRFRRRDANAIRKDVNASAVELKYARCTGTRRPLCIHDVRLRPCFKFQTAVRVYFLNLHEVAGGAGKLKVMPQAGGNEIERYAIKLMIAEWSSDWFFSLSSNR